MKKNVLAAFILIGTLSTSLIAYGTTTGSGVQTTSAPTVEGGSGITQGAITPAAVVTRPTDLNLGNGMVFNGEEKKMSLAQAKELVMASSSGIEIAKINMAANKAKTESYYQTYRKTNATYPDPIFGGTITSSRTEKAMTKLMADFAKVQSENNYQAEINVLNADAIKNYFELQQAIRARTISENNLSTQATIL